MILNKNSIISRLKCEGFEWGDIFKKNYGTTHWSHLFRAPGFKAPSNLKKPIISISCIPVISRTGPMKIKEKQKQTQPVSRLVPHLGDTTDHRIPAFFAPHVQWVRSTEKIQTSGPVRASTIVCGWNEGENNFPGPQLERSLASGTSKMREQGILY